MGPPAVVPLIASGPPGPPAGALVVSLEWDTEADLDLHVVTPDGVEIWAGNINSYQAPPPGTPVDPAAWQAGGILDLDSNAGCVIDGRQIWWDVRPHILYPTLEYRICDIPMRAEETIAIAALLQAVTAKLWRLMSGNLSFRTYRRALVMENKWRAARWGMGGKLIDFGKEEEVEVKSLIAELLEFVDEVVDDLGSRDAIRYVETMLERGSGAERQLAVWRRTQDLKAVVDYVVEETEHGLPLDGAGDAPRGVSGARA